MKCWMCAAIFFPIIYIFIMYSPFFLDIYPKGFSKPFPSFDGPLEENYKLNEAEKLYTNQVKGPESIVFHDGYMYTGLAGGRIVKIKDGKVTTIAQTGRSCEMPHDEIQCGRPLGLRVGKDGFLYVIDGFYGIFTMNFTTGILTKILPSSTIIGGRPLVFPDDLDIDDEGNIYLTDASTKWDLTKSVYVRIEHDDSGRIIRYNMHTQKTEVLVSNLHLPNGIQLSKDKKSLLINEFLKRRILRHYLKGPKKGQLEIFADNLPGEPDNIRESPRGYWVAIISARNSSNILDTIHSYPEVKRLWGKVHSAIGNLLWFVAELIGNSEIKSYVYQFKRGIYLSYLPQRGLVIEIDETGKILRSLHSPDGLFGFISEAREQNGYLYLGSFYNNYLGRLKL